MVSVETKGLALVFEGSDPLYLELAQEGAASAGWDSLVFNDPADALEHLKPGVGALITSLGYALILGSGHHPADRLIARSNELNVPRALLSGHPRAGDLLRPNSSDTLVSKLEHDIPGKLTGWLRSLTKAA